MMPYCPIATGRSCWWPSCRLPCGMLVGLAAVSVVASFLPCDALYIVQSAVLRSHVVRPSVCLSVCLSVTLVICDHIGWKSWKLIARAISPTLSLFVAKRRSTGATENAGPGQCRTSNMADQITGLENARPGNDGGGGKYRTYKNDGTNRRSDNARPVTGWQDASLRSQHN